MELRDKLRKYGVEATNEDDNNDLLLIYDTVKSNPLYCASDCENVKYPLETANYLQHLEKGSLMSFS
jgi:hypothetical protein